MRRSSASSSSDGSSTRPSARRARLPELDEVDRARVRELDAELGREVQQHDAQRREMAPLPFRVARLRQRLGRVERGANAFLRSAAARAAASAWRVAAACAGPKPSFLRSCLRQSPLRVSSSSAAARHAASAPLRDRRRGVDREPRRSRVPDAVVGRVLGGLAQRRANVREQRRLRERRERRELVVDEPAQRGLELGAQLGWIAAEQVRQPLIALREQRREQLLELGEVVDAAQHRAQTLAGLARGRHRRDRALRGAAVVLARVVRESARPRRRRTAPAAAARARR